jgi:hypothetical protein
MKRLILASILCLSPAMLSAQEKPRLVDPSVMFPPLVPSPMLTSPNLWGVIQNQQANQKHALVQPRHAYLVKGFGEYLPGVCSVPLLEAHVDVADPGIAVTPGGSAVPIRKAHVPAPPCKR